MPSRWLAILRVLLRTVSLGEPGDSLGKREWTSKLG